MVHKLRDSFAAGFHTDANFRYLLSKKFRPERKIFEAVLVAPVGTAAWPKYGREVLRQRSEWLSPVMTDLKQCARASRLSVPLTELAPSYLHLHANRLLRSAHRAQELVLYDFLARLYDAQAARASA